MLFWSSFRNLDLCLWIKTILMTCWWPINWMFHTFCKLTQNNFKTNNEQCKTDKQALWTSVLFCEIPDKPKKYFLKYQALVILKEKLTAIYFFIIKRCNLSECLVWAFFSSMLITVTSYVPRLIWGLMTLFKN